MASFLGLLSTGFLVPLEQWPGFRLALCCLDFLFGIMGSKSGINQVDGGSFSIRTMLSKGYNRDFIESSLRLCCATVLISTIRFIAFHFVIEASFRSFSLLSLNRNLLTREEVSGTVIHAICSLIST